MLEQKGKATVGGTMARPTHKAVLLASKSYYKHNGQSSEKSIDRQEKITERRKQIPKLYRGIYDKAVTGRSRKAAMHAFCLECCGYQIKEVYLCTDLGCPLYPYRPRSRVSPVAPESVQDEPESTNSGQRIAEEYGQ